MTKTIAHQVDAADVRVVEHYPQDLVDAGDAGPAQKATKAGNNVAVTSAAALGL